MAVRQHNQSRAPLPAAPAVARRDVLAGALAAPLALPRHPGLDPGSTFFGEAEGKNRWMPDHGAAQPVRGTGEQRTRHDELHWQKALARYRAAEAALAAVAGVEDDDIYDRHLLRFNAALKKLLRTPAPASGLVLKLELTIEHLAWELTGGERCMAALLQDARRLAASGS